MKKGLTEMVFILDRSGSMAGLEEDTIGGFNGMIEKQKKQEGDAFVTTVLFDDLTEILYDRAPLEKIGRMTEKEYFVRGCTALLDAIGQTIAHIDGIHRYAREEDVPEHTVFVITTDGMENASKEYNVETVKKLIEEHKKEKGWEFVFIGANIDAVETARTFGIEKDRAVKYRADKKGTKILYESVCEVMECVRAGAPIKADWSRKIKKDTDSGRR